MFDNLLQNLFQSDFLNSVEETKKELEQQIFEEVSQGNFVKIKMNGIGKIIDLKISKEIFDEGDNETLEDLIMTTYKKAIEKTEKNKLKIIEEAHSEMLNIENFFNESFGEIEEDEFDNEQSDEDQKK